MRRRALQVAIVVGSVVGTVGSALLRGEAAANPPAPTNMPDPPLVAPKVAETPSLVRKHDGGCYVSYPSGGNAKVDCPAELVKEPVGEEIDRDKSTGKCNYVATVSWSGGSMGPVACPALLLEVAKVAGAATGTPTITPIDPPMGGLTPQPTSSGAPLGKEPKARRIDDSPPKSGCAGGCVVARDEDPSLAPVGVTLATALVFVGRRRRRR